MHSSASTRRSLVAQPTRNVRAFSSRPNRPVEVAVASPDAESVSTPPPAPFFVKEKKPQLNVIEKSAWVDGIPSVMGGHLMASGAIAPFSTSKGAGIDVPPHEFQYPDGEFACSLKMHGSPEDVSESLLALIRKASAEAIAKKGSFSIALPGGSVLNYLQALRTATDIDFSKWHLFFVDERNVPLSSSDSNYKAAMETFLGYVPIPYFNIRHLAEGLTASQAATHYEGLLLGSPADVLPRNPDGFPVFDCVILGMGADTHVASLFPNHSSTSETSRWVVPVEDAHKAPAERISFSLPVINSAEHVALVVTGEEKAFAVQRVLELQSLPGAMPAQLVRPTAGELVWLLDEAAAGRLRMTEWEDTETKAFPRTLMK